MQSAIGDVAVQPKTPISHFRRRSSIYSSSGRVRSPFKSPQRSPGTPKEHSESKERAAPDSVGEISDSDTESVVIPCKKRKRAIFHTPSTEARTEESLVIGPLETNFISEVVCAQTKVDKAEAVFSCALDPENNQDNKAAEVQSTKTAATLDQADDNNSIREDRLNIGTVELTDENELLSSSLPLHVISEVVCAQTKVDKEEAVVSCILDQENNQSNKEAGIQATERAATLEPADAINNIRVDHLNIGTVELPHENELSSSSLPSNVISEVVCAQTKIDKEEAVVSCILDQENNQSNKEVEIQATKSAATPDEDKLLSSSLPLNIISEVACAQTKVDKEEAVVFCALEPENNQSNKAAEVQSTKTIATLELADANNNTRVVHPNIFTVKLHDENKLLSSSVPLLADLEILPKENCDLEKIFLEGRLQISKAKCFVESCDENQNEQSEVGDIRLLGHSNDPTFHIDTEQTEAGISDSTLGVKAVNLEISQEKQRKEENCSPSFIPEECYADWIHTKRTLRFSF